MQFKDVVGQQEVKSQLLKQVKNGRIAHAQLFLGGEGSGNLALAIALAQYLNCQNRTDEDSCGTCPSCSKYNQLIHPDLHFTYPTIGAKALSTNFLTEWREAIGKNPYLTAFEWLQYLGAENKQGNITAEECRDIIHKLSMKTYESEFKVLILWMPEYLGVTGNVLLKMIEEPPQKTLFILVANNQDNILTTIKSRAQLVKIPVLKDEAIAQALVDKMEMNELQANSVAYLSNGDYNAALQLAVEHDNTFFDEFRNWMLNCYQNNMPAVVQWIEEFAGVGRERLKGFLNYGQHLIRESMRMSVGGVENLKLIKNEQEFVVNFSKFINLDNGEIIYKELNDAIMHIERNANPKIILINVSLTLRNVLRTKPSLVK